MKRFSIILLVLWSTFSLTGCFKDLGNYDYTEINEVVIADQGFEETYDCRMGIDRLVIHPEITFSQDPEGTGEYHYEWVAVSQNFNRGKRFVLGKEKNLDYEVRLAADEYLLYLKVKEVETGLVTSKQVGLNVRSNYSTGWLLGGTDASGKGQVDMISISNDTLYIHNTLVKKEGLDFGSVDLVWVDNDEWTSDDRLYVASAEGTYKFDRINFDGSPYTSLGFSFALPPASDRFCMTDCQKIADKRHVIIVDNQAFMVSSNGGMIENTFSFYSDDPLMEPFRTAPYMLCNHRMKDIRMFVFYNEENQEFCYISGLTVKGMKRLKDGLEDTYSWNTAKDFPSGLEMVAGVNSFFGNGQSAAIMKDSQGRHVIYCMTANNTGSLNKEGRYLVSEEIPGFAHSPSYAMTTHHGILLYADGNRLYGYQFRKQPQEFRLLKEFDAPVTCIMMDHESSEKFNDVFYVATYDEQQKGVLHKFSMVDHPDKIQIEEVQKLEGQFLKIQSMCYKKF